jgi:peptidylprolyl isomerase domain and WD repeat-containing protein 1
MSDSEQDASVLGKRARNAPEADISEDADMNPPSATQDDDDSDDDVGPMPMAESAPTNAATKKKRKVRRVRNGAPQAHWSPDHTPSS